MRDIRSMHIVLFGLAQASPIAKLADASAREQKAAEERWRNWGHGQYADACARGQALCGVTVTDPMNPVSVVGIDSLSQVKENDLCVACASVARVKLGRLK